MASDPAPHVFRPGMEVADVPEFTPPEIRPGALEWQKYRAPRFGPRVRALITIAVIAVPAFLMCGAVLQVLMGDGRARAAAVILLLPLVPGVPLLVRAWRDLWGSGER